MITRSPYWLVPVVCIVLSWPRPSRAVELGALGGFRLGATTKACDARIHVRKWTAVRTRVTFRTGNGQATLDVWRIDPPIGTFRRITLYFAGGRVLRIAGYFRDVKELNQTKRSWETAFGSPSRVARKTSFWFRDKRVGASITAELGRVQWVDLRRAIELGLLATSDFVRQAPRPTPTSLPTNANKPAPTSKPTPTQANKPTPTNKPAPKRVKEPAPPMKKPAPTKQTTPNGN
ncbi:MAG: hypothetical protein KC609_24430 [Myxococcales bacterium]|nr:hypothetical protein [Myxococcales bacterium]